MAEDDVERLVAEALDRNHCEGEDYFRCHLCNQTISGPAEWVQQIVESHNCKTLRLARIVRELLAELPRAKGCEFYPFYKYGCRDGQPTDPEGFCPPCRARALRERLNRLARGEEA